MKPARPTPIPMWPGVGLGLVLLAAFILTGQGLGASGAFANAASGLVGAVGAGRKPPATAISRATCAAGAPWSAWIVLEILGVIAGGAALGAAWRGRFAMRIEARPGLGRPGAPDGGRRPAAWSWDWAPCWRAAAPAARLCPAARCSASAAGPSWSPVRRRLCRGAPVAEAVAVSFTQQPSAGRLR